MYLSLPFALAGAACVLTGGPFCSLREERGHHLVFIMADGRVWGGQGVGEGLGSPKVGLSLTVPVRDRHPEIFT